jgi:hypothetical protein
MLGLGQAPRPLHQMEECKTAQTELYLRHAQQRFSFFTLRVWNNTRIRSFRGTRVQSSKWFDRSSLGQANTAIAKRKTRRSFIGKSHCSVYRKRPLESRMLLQNPVFCDQDPISG